MPLLSQPRREFYLHQIRISTNAVLQFNYSAGHGMSVWKWPINDAGERITPSALCEHRLSHRFLGPCCICPVMARDQRRFTEAAILMAPSGCHAGQYIAWCAQDKCGYIVHIEDIYSKIGVPLHAYARRDVEEPRPEPVVYLGNRDNENSIGPARTSRSRLLKRSYAMADIGNSSIPSPRRRPTAHPRKLLLRLDSAVRPGISEGDFRSLFTKCACGLITTRGAFKSHHCENESLTAEDVIEITDDEE